MKRNTGVGEWAGRSCNLEQVGCPSDCRYCYAKAMAIRFGRATAESWKHPTEPKLKYVPKHAKHGVTMHPTAHDVTMKNAVQCYRQVGLILASGDDVLFVSKARKEPLSVALENFIGNLNVQSRIEVRVTIGSANPEVLKYWEPGAPTFDERIAALKWAHDAGFKTSVSTEPMLDPFPGAVIDLVRPFVSPECGIWLGRANRLTQTVAVNCPGDKEAKEKADRLNALWCDSAVRILYNDWKADPLIRWKDSIRAVVGL